MGENTVVEVVKKNCTTVAIISHTGGTTGEPKGVMCSDRNINAEIWQIGCNLSHKRQERVLVVLPPFINYSLVNAMLEPLAFGFSVILVPKYEPDKFDEYVRKYRSNHLNSIPAYYEACLFNEKLKKTDLSCLKYIFYGGDAMSVKKEEEVNSLLESCGATMKLEGDEGIQRLRDELATLKWKLMEYEFKNESITVPHGDAGIAYWEQIIKEEIKTVKFYDRISEQQCIYRES